MSKYGRSSVRRKRGVRPNPPSNKRDMAESPNYTNTPCHDVTVLVLVALAVKKRALTLVTVPSALSFGKAIYSVIRFD